MRRKTNIRFSVAAWFIAAVSCFFFPAPMASAAGKVAILGTGIVSSQGLDVSSFWHQLTSRKASVGPVSHFPLEADYPFRVAAEVPKKDEALLGELASCPDLLLRQSRRGPVTMKRQDLLAVWAAQEARRSAFFDVASRQWRAPLETERIGAIIGSTMGGPVRAGTANGKMLANYQFCATSAVTYALGLDAFSLSVSGACASGLQAIVAGAIALKADQADVMYVGGTDAQTTRDAFESRNGILSRANVARPFAQEADGIVLGEGAAVLVATTEAHARTRGYVPVATVEGFQSLVGGENTDVPDAEWVARVVRSALSNARIPVDALDGNNTVILAHGPGNPKGDVPELRGIQQVFGPDARRIPIVSLASWLGHPLGPAGAFRAVAAVEILRHRWVFGNLQLGTRHPGHEELHLPGPEGLALPGVRYVIALSLGLGGNYACVVFGKSL